MKKVRNNTWLNTKISPEESKTLSELHMAGVFLAIVFREWSK